jgi:prepilin-type N-terminal cleavage/methylation domain-containing protein
VNWSGNSRQDGLSLIELMLVVTAVSVLVAFAVPNMMTGVANMRLRGAASDFSGLVQQARIMAVQTNCQGNTNKAYTINFGLPTGNGAYVDLNNNGSYDLALSPALGNVASEPMIQFGGTANQVAAPAGAGGKPSNVDASGGPLGWTATSGNLSFNSRGLPCSLSGGVCTTNVGFVFYFSDTRGVGGPGWAAVSITAAGHPKVWWWNGSSWIN